jgi:Peptidase family M1 domain
MRIFTSFFAFFFLLKIAFAQQLYVARNLQPAFEKNTRSFDGLPGKNYWQNRAAYDIKVSLDVPKRTLSGHESIEYTNESPDSLKILIFNMVQDLYKPGTARQDDLGKADFTNGFEIKNLTINGEKFPLENEERAERFGTTMTLVLTKPMPPKSTLKIELDYAFLIPATRNSSRQCRCDSTTFFMAYWYPQVAVYDDLQGWDRSGHNGQAEFYGDFSTYEVELNLPQNMMAWATGVWQNATQLLDNQPLARYEQSMKTDSVVHVFTKKDLEKGGLFKKAKRNIFRFSAEKVTDFAWSCSDHYSWDACSFSPEKGRRTNVNAAFDDASKDYHQVAEIARMGMFLMGTYLPGYPYPYPTMTVFDGNDGMEYPMMCNDASQGDGDAAGLTLHEISHTYFPFLMGINEKKYAWMDEGWASFHDLTLVDTLRHKNGKVRGYARVAGTELDVPPMAGLSAEMDQAYTSSTYWRPQSAYLTLYDMLGYERFHACQTAYIDRWKYKHPMPHDFFNTYNMVSNMDLNWFWKAWFFEPGYPDLAVGSAEKSGENVIISVKKLGNLPVPVHFIIEFEGGKKVEYHQTADVWEDGRREFSCTIPMPETGKLVKVTLGSPRIPDVNLKDNIFNLK